MQSERAVLVKSTTELNFGFFMIFRASFHILCSGVGYHFLHLRLSKCNETQKWDD